MPPIERLTIAHKPCTSAAASEASTSNSNLATKASRQCTQAVQHWTMETWKSRRSNALQGTHSLCLRVLHLELFQVHYECHSTPSPQRVPHRAPQATFQALQQVIPLQRIQLLQRVQPLQRSRPGSKSDLRSGWKPCGRCDLCSGSSLSVLLGRYTHTI